MVNGSGWATQQEGNVLRKRLVSCPVGHVLVRDDTLGAIADQCIQCSFGKYSAIEARYPDVMRAEQVQAAGELCRLCEPGAACPGGNVLIPNKGFWLLPQDRSKVSAERQSEHTGLAGGDPRVKVYRCPLNACEEGGSCVAGRTGRICGLCEEGYAVSGMVCQKCSGFSSNTSQYTALGVGVALFLLLWYYLSWQPYFARNEEPQSCEAEGGEEAPTQCFGSERLGGLMGFVQTKMRNVLLWWLDSNIMDYLKIFITFWQITSTYQVNMMIEWPGELKKIWEMGSVFRLDFLRFPGVSCLSSGYSFLTILQACTVGPIVVSLLLAIPSLLLMLSKSEDSERIKRVRDRYWYMQMFWFFLLYPLLSGVAVSGFNCVEIGGTNWVATDVKEPCPLDDKLSPTFAWACACLCMYPLGVPLFIFVVMRHFRVGELAATKINNAVLREMLFKYKEFTARSLVSKIAGYVGAGGDERVLEERTTQMFLGACRESSSAASLDIADFVAYLRTIGIVGNHQEEVENLIRVYDDDGNGTLELDEFREMIQQIVHIASEITGFEIMDDIGDAQLDKLCSFPWEELVAEDEDENSGIRRELKKKLKKAEEQKEQQEMLRSFQTEHTHPPTHKEQQEMFRALHTEHTHPAASASRRDKILWVMTMGKMLLFRGVISIPTVRWDSSVRGEEEVVDRIGFLFDAYKTQYWFFEILEMGRKFILIALISFMYAGSPHQCAGALFITAVFLMGFLKVSPFASTVFDTMEAISLIAQCATLFYGLMLTVQELAPHAGASEKEISKYLIIFLNLCIFILPFWGFIKDKLLLCWRIASRKRTQPSEGQGTSPDTRASAMTLEHRLTAGVAAERDGRDGEGSRPPPRVIDVFGGGVGQGAGGREGESAGEKAGMSGSMREIGLAEGPTAWSDVAVCELSSMQGSGSGGGGGTARGEGLGGNDKAHGDGEGATERELVLKPPPAPIPLGPMASLTLPPASSQTPLFPQSGPQNNLRTPPPVAPDVLSENFPAVEDSVGGQGTGVWQLNCVSGEIAFAMRSGVIPGHEPALPPFWFLRNDETGRSDRTADGDQV
mmetsp:Transcript_3588/g.7259  ORF Transcript_3588/g.7259 Transcript_3588/m.7259 type:complete len:1072 (+) Transcript_3588:1669-4884(+)